MFGGGVSFVDFLRRFEKMVSSSEAVTPKSAKTYSHKYQTDLKTCMYHIYLMCSV
jgi:hypothetical protein